MTDWAFWDFVGTAAVFFLSLPLVYASWSSGVMSGMFQQARDNGWVYPPRKGSVNYKKPVEVGDVIQWPTK